MAATASFLDVDQTNIMGAEKLTHEIFSILENKFLFGCDDDNSSKLKLGSSPPVDTGKDISVGKVRVLCIDAGGSTDGILAAKSVVRIEASLKARSGNPSACIADYFDLVAGAGAGGVLAALLFTKRKDGKPMFTAEQALKFLLENGRKVSQPSPKGVLRRVFRPVKAEKLFKKVFGDLTLKDTLKAVLIPCYDMASGSPFVFSRADALELDSYDFNIAAVCAATVAEAKAEMKSIDGRTKLAAVGGGVAMNNPTAVAITHVLNNKQEFPFCKGVEDLLVVSLGNGDSVSAAGAGNMMASPAAFVKVAGDGAADMVDQAVSMAFGELRTNNYVRIQGNRMIGKKQTNIERKNMLKIAEEMLAEKNVESVLFKGKKLAKKTNLEKLEMFSGELVKEEEKRKTNIFPIVVLKQASPSPTPRTSSATTLSTASSY